MRHASAKGKVALVLGASVRPDGSPSPSLLRRALAAVDLWQSGQVAEILACGGGPAGRPTEAEMIAEICTRSGVPAAVVLLENRSRTTEENFAFASEVLQTVHGSEELPEIFVVTDLYHQPRARLVSHRVGFSARSHWPDMRTARPWPFLRALLREVPAFVWYWLAGKGRKRLP